MKKNKNIVSNWSGLQNGSVDKQIQRNVTLNEILMKSSFLSNLVSTQTYEFLSNKALSSLEWHPKQNSVLIGCRGGQVSCVDINTRSVRQCIRGGGRGQQITGIKFDLLDNQWFYTSSSSGKIIKHRIDGREDITLKNSSDSDELFYSRFSCLDVSSDRKLLISGDNKGYIHWMPSTETSKKVSTDNLQTIRIHNSNILQCEFNKFNTNMFITASIDCTAKLWDIRMFSNKCVKPVLTLRHREPLNSATFSSSDGSTLLVTNHVNEICVYRGPNWQLDSLIIHSHQQTLRFGLLKPSWHPLLDLFIIGSFSLDPLVSGQFLDKPQTIDVFDAKKGIIVRQLSDKQSGVITMSCFNSCGDVIAGIRGRNLIVFESNVNQ